jgi:hypothetical protein
MKNNENVCQPFHFLLQHAMSYGLMNISQSPFKANQLLLLQDLRMQWDIMPQYSADEEISKVYKFKLPDGGDW